MDLLTRLLLSVSILFAIYLITGCSEQPVHRDYYRDGNFEHHYRHYPHEGHHLPQQYYPPR